MIYYSVTIVVATILIVVFLKCNKKTLIISPLSPEEKKEARDAIVQMTDNRSRIIEAKRKKAKENGCR
ncbi:MAG: hypothetical protein P9L92_00960 [Candidatus Electryonea clarkiae]|nr:hypothetical protein [Candidatus Electryonea clarkiae]MDP8289182.1 hypothetical protein [Candidatus Electryonea clarkiae]